jgi:hypothetical protein
MVEGDTEARQMSTTTYPVHVEAHLDTEPSRWRWLFKWVLAIPHYVVLGFLWVAFTAMSFVAFVAIMFTGHYPRRGFDFNVGVLRWTWRVAYYAYGALATDRYPPFSLRERPDYPAHLQIEYPERLSRGLVLVKWWLLAIPHYLVIALFLGGTGFALADAGDDRRALAGPGLIGLLVLVAGVVLLFTGRYPRAVYDLLLGLNRWVLRVAAYAALMTDVYPPFRLDQGGDDPADVLTPEPTTPGPASADRMPTSAGLSDRAPHTPVVGTGAPAGSARPSSSGAGRVLAVVVGSVMLLGSLVLGLGGVGLGVADHGLRDDDGYLMSGSTQLGTETFAITSRSITVHANGPSSFMPHHMLGEVRVSATAHGAPVFVGIARTRDVDAYLAGVGRATVTDLTGHPAYDVRRGAAPSVLPSRAGIWVAQSTGTGKQQLTWTAENGDWTLVLMNADGSRGVTTTVAAGATVPALDWLVPALILSAAGGLIAATVLLVVGLRGASADAPDTQV